MNTYQCFASTFCSVKTMEQNMNFDPLDIKPIMDALPLEGATIKDAIQNFVNTDEFVAYFNKHKYWRNIFLYYYEENQIVSYTGIIDA